MTAMTSPVPPFLFCASRRLLSRASFLSRNVVMFGNEEDVEKMDGMGMRCVLGVNDLWKEIGIRRVGV